MQKNSWTDQIATLVAKNFGKVMTLMITFVIAGTSTLVYQSAQITSQTSPSLAQEETTETPVVETQTQETDQSKAVEDVKVEIVSIVLSCDQKITYMKQQGITKSDGTEL